MATPAAQVNAEKNIDGLCFTTVKFMGRAATHIGKRMIGLFAGKDVDLFTTISRLPDAEFDDIINRLLTGTSVNGESLAVEEVFDRVFQGRLDLLFKVIAWVVEVNLSGFFGGQLGAKIRAAISKATTTVSSSASPPTSPTSPTTGSSGASGETAASLPTS